MCGQRTHCRKGHELTSENLSIRPNGKRRCKKCENDYKIKYAPKQLIISTNWGKENPEKRKAIMRKHNHKRQPEQTKYRKEKWWVPYIAKLRVETFTRYGKGKMECVCCGINIIQFLTIDHINGRTPDEKKNQFRRGWMGYQHLRSKGYPEGYQTLCWNCNSGRQLNNGICPHKLIDNNKPDSI